MSCYAMLCSALHSTLLNSTLLYCSTLHYAKPYQTILCICTEENLGQLSYNLHRENYTAYFNGTPRMHLGNLKNPSRTTSKSIQNASQIHLGTLPGTGPEKNSLIADLKGTKGAQNASKKHTRKRLNTQLAHLCGHKAAIESVTVFNTVLNGF